LGKTLSKPAAPGWQRRLLVIEDEGFLASLLIRALQDKGFDAKTCPDAITAKHLVEEFDPDAVLIDINLGTGPNGLQFGEWLRKTHADVVQIYLTGTTDPRIWHEFVDSGGPNWFANCTFLSKDKLADSNTLIDCINSALSDKQPTELSVYQADQLLQGLTKAQLAILKLAAEGFSNASIARQRGTALRTVEQQLQAAYVKIGIDQSGEMNPRVQAVRAFLRASGAR
jgi:DNA-binding NarL/FixJ family response regulator